MRALLDTNVLIAILDEDHVFHAHARQWIADNVSNGWASCPLSENGALRILSNPGYSRHRRFPLSVLIHVVTQFISKTDHRFWPDDVSILEPSILDTSRIHGPRQLTALYLLALAARNGGRLVTFDQGILASAVSLANPENLLVI